jgi:outer membrane protein assembly factor BamD
LKYSEHQRGAASALVALLLIAALSIAGASCGGPYTPKRINVSGEKLALADRLFARGKYGDAALEYKDFLATFAGDERCDYAQFRLAESYRMDKEYSLAEVEYQILISDYGYSDYVDDSFFLEGLCAFKQSPGVERDQTKTLEALDRLNRFVQLFPKSDRVQEANAVLHEIRMKLGERAFLDAKLYFSGKHYDAALIYLDKIIDEYPDTAWALRSRYYRGYIRESRSDWQGAEEDYREVLSASGTYPEKAKAQKRMALFEARGETSRSDGK